MKPPASALGLRFGSKIRDGRLHMSNVTEENSRKHARAGGRGNEKERSKGTTLLHNASNLNSLHFATAQTTGAHVHTGRRSVHIHADTLRVRSPGTASFMVGMAHVVAGDNTLVANLTKLSHRSHLL